MVDAEVSRRLENRDEDGHQIYMALVMKLVKMNIVKIERTTKITEVMNAVEVDCDDGLEGRK